MEIDLTKSQGKREEREKLFYLLGRKSFWTRFSVVAILLLKWKKDSKERRERGGGVNKLCLNASFESGRCLEEFYFFSLSLLSFSLLFHLLFSVFWTHIQVNALDVVGFVQYCLIPKGVRQTNISANVSPSLPSSLFCFFLLWLSVGWL